MSTKIYFITGNKNKTTIFNQVMRPEFEVNWFKPKAEIKELESISVNEVVTDKVNQAVQQFKQPNGSPGEFVFVTDVGLYIEQLGGRPGGMIKRETNRLFNGDFKQWCNYLDVSKTRNAYVQMVIVAKNGDGKIITIDHRVPGKIPETPMPGEFGFDWDEVFVPEPSLVKPEYQNMSFAQIPQAEKFRVLMEPAIGEFKEKLNKVI